MILLPEEWFSKYANLLEMGIQTEKGIRLKHTFVGAAQTALGEEELKKFPVKQQIQKYCRTQKPQSNVTSLSAERILMDGTFA